MNQKNIAYWIGTDVRRDLAVPYSHLYPGPGHYEPDDIPVQTAVSFPHEAKNTRIEKTYEPGPASYGTFDTVGAIAGYQNNGANAREVTVAPRKNE